MRSGNPAFSNLRTGNPVFSNPLLNDLVQTRDSSASMTVEGTAFKSLALLLILLVAAAFTWSQASAGTLNPGIVLVGVFGGLIVGLVTSFKPTLAPITGPIYAVLEGLFLGAVSFLINQRYPGKNLASQAVLLTIATLFMMLVIYGTRIIRVTQRFAAGVIAATGAIMLVYLASMVLSLFHVAVPVIHDASPLGIGFSVAVVGLAAFNLLLDFDFIERGEARGLPKAMEWYGAFGLLVTLIWLYLEILRLLSKLNDRR